MLCSLVYTEFNESDVMLNERLDLGEKRRLLEAYQSIAERRYTGLSRDAVLGRLAAWVKRLGVHDVLIVAAARSLDAHLLTADEGQAVFAAKLLGRKRVIHIPLAGLQCGT